MGPLPLAGHRLDRLRGLLLDAHGQRVMLRRQTMAVLLELARRPGEIVSKQFLLDAVWRDCVVTDDSLVQCVLEIRRALGPPGAWLVQTLPRRGYLLDLAGAEDAADRVAGDVPADQSGRLERQPQGTSWFCGRASGPACGPVSGPVSGPMGWLNFLARPAAATKVPAL
jgi:DNA-binding winged helix-turn-helix (wHTH) protein